MSNRYDFLRQASFKFCWAGVFAVWLLAAVCSCPIACLAQEAASEKEDFFEEHVRPVLVQHCWECHGPDEAAGGLRLDSLAHLLEGGHTSEAIVPGDPANSLLIRAVRRRGDLAMPPDEPLSERQIQALEQWIAAGATWPESFKPALTMPEAGKHWAFEKIRAVVPPKVTSDDVQHNPIDAFVASKRKLAGLGMSPAADRRTLIRRLHHVLTGLPPDAEAVERFVSNPSSDAYEQLVDRLLASPRFGEQWARHWLDVARYSDTKGYVYAREERRWVHAWVYRDWVVRALNEDMPYDRFLLLQLAADQVDDRRPEDLAAMGYLTIGRRFLGVRRDIIDDQIDVVCRGMLGLTVNCARCHDHKYDPIPTADYYSLYGVFDSCLEDMVRLSPVSSDKAFEQELAKHQEALRSAMQAARETSSERVRMRIADYLYAQSELHKYPASGFDQVFQADDLLPAFVHRWRDYLEDRRTEPDSIFQMWHAYYALPAETFAEQAVAVNDRLLNSSGEFVHPLLANEFPRPPTSFRDVCDRYGQLFAEVLRKSRVGSEAEFAADPDRHQARMLGENPELAPFLAVLFGHQAPCSVPEGPIANTEAYFDTDTCTELWKLQGNIDRTIIDADQEVAFARTLTDMRQPVEPHIFRRGDPMKPGRQVPRQFLVALAGGEQQAFKRGSGRLELAQNIIAPGNPLTARVVVNRIWMHYFGQGLVTTPSDFGTRASKPSHPELLDWLAGELMRSNWNVKTLHRLILLSSTFQQSSLGPADAEQLVRAQRIDPDNRLLWRMNPRRLSFEELRDALGAVSSQLDLRLGGKPRELFPAQPPLRRSLYGLIDRQYLPVLLRTFDFATPDLHVAQRNETTVPQQALFFMNHPAVLTAARHAVVELDESASDDRIRTLFLKIFQRTPTEDETQEALALLEAAAANDPTSAVPPTAKDWSYGYGRVNEAEGKTASFELLPHFSGNAWQGGSSWPDDQLGWLQLTAEGGHPGNDLEHAVIRRWVAPRDLSLGIESHVRHEPEAGDGIRVFILHSEQGLLHSANLHHAQDKWTSAPLQVRAGDSVDFVVDIGAGLNSDQFLWELDLLDKGNPDAQSWNAATDFQADESQRLNPWEQLAQILLCTNEFLFVD